MSDPNDRVTANPRSAFRAFIRDELMPEIDRRYRTTGETAIVGESAAGLFVMETLVLAPDMFDAYIAIDPSLWWDQERLSKDAAKGIGAAQAKRPIFLAIASEQLEKPAPMSRMAAALSARSARWCVAARPDLFHATIYQQLTPQLLQFLFPPKEPPPTEYGFKVTCTAGP